MLAKESCQFQKSGSATGVVVCAWQITSFAERVVMSTNDQHRQTGVARSPSRNDVRILPSAGVKRLHPRRSVRNTEASGDVLGGAVEILRMIRASRPHVIGEKRNVLSKQLRIRALQALER